MAEKAIIDVLEGPNKGTLEVIRYNPREYSVSTSSKTSDEGSGVRFTQVNKEDFSVSLFFDTYEKKSDVRKETEKIVSLIMPTVEKKDTKQPPVCRFVWGSFDYKGVIHKVDQKFTMFLQSGIPVRAELTVTFKSVVTKEEDAQLKGKDACRKLWRVKTGDRLDLIAHKALKDPAQWRRIALANDIVNPFAFPKDDDIGTLLIIPD
jgi:hypothetical protein